MLTSSAMIVFKCNFASKKSKTEFEQNFIKFKKKRFRIYKFENLNNFNRNTYRKFKVLPSFFWANFLSESLAKSNSSRANSKSEAHSCTSRSPASSTCSSSAARFRAIRSSSLSSFSFSMLSKIFLVFLFLQFKIKLKLNHSRSFASAE